MVWREGGGSFKAPPYFFIGGQFQGFFWGTNKGSHLEKVRQMKAKPAKHCSRTQNPSAGLWCWDSLSRRLYLLPMTSSFSPVWY